MDGNNSKWHSLYKEAWNKYIFHNTLDETIVRPEIASSWERCRELSVDPLKDQVMKVQTPEEFEETKRRRKLLIQTARPYISLLGDYAIRSGFTMFLADPQGTVLVLGGDKKELERQQQFNLKEGAIWSEQTAGTNAVGTCIYTKKPLQVVGEEHYCAFQHNITCSGAPIYDTEEKLIGILNMSGRCEDVNVHTLGMVVACAKAIQNQIKLVETMDELRHSNIIMNTTLESVPNAVITVDEHGYITQINKLGARMLNVSNQEAIGKCLTELIPTERDLLSILRAGDADGIEVLLDSEGSAIRCNIHSNGIFSAGGKYLGSVLLFNKREQVVKLVNQVTGAQSKFSFDTLIGEDRQYLKAKRIGQDVAKTDARVLLLGESGTGKELFAQAIHAASGRKGSFIAINCAAIPRTLIESELFGYEASAFTGADHNGRPGKFELAHNGTLFLDEIADMPMDLQATLLRVLQQREVVRIGGQKPVAVNVRVIAATNKDLPQMIQDKTFREDLYYRINVVTIKIPPLRQRKNDISLLISVLLPQISKRMNKSITEIRTEAIKHLLAYDWPGNVRELENILERCVVVAQGHCIGAEDLPDYIFNTGNHDITQFVGLGLEQTECEAIKEALKYHRTKGEAAQALGISRSTLYRKMAYYSIES